MSSHKAMAHPEHNHNLHTLQQNLELLIRCEKCCRKKTDISYDLLPSFHECSKNILLAREKGRNNKWRAIAPRPKSPNPPKYLVCWYYNEITGCTVHGQKCSYARSNEEANIWNFMKNECLDFNQLMNLLNKGARAQEGTISNSQGKFLELCKICFSGSPQKISSRMNGTQCVSGHTWKPALVFCLYDAQKREVYEEIRPLPKNDVKQWRFCKYVKKRQPCRHGAHRCLFAHSQVEMKVWESELNEGLNRLDLIHATQTLQTHAAQPTLHTRGQNYCHVCKKSFPIYEEFMNHCFTMEHRKLIFDDSAFTWKHRDPPLTSKTYRLCERRLTCEYGDCCTEAHSEEELLEWQERHRAIQRKIRAAADEGLLSYQDLLLEEYRHNENKEIIMKETLPDVSVSCDSNLNISVRQQNISHRWNFQIVSKASLDVVALLKQDRGAKFALGEDSYKGRTYSTGVWFETSDPTTDNTDKVYKIMVSFTSDQPGMYEQWLVFDFDMRPVLLQKLIVRVGEQLLLYHEKTQKNELTEENSDGFTMTPGQENTQPSKQVLETWNEDTVDIVPYLPREERDQELLKKYRCAERQQLDTATRGIGSINHQNYKEMMHSFLYQEETAQNQLISRLNFQGNMSFTQILSGDWFGHKYAIPGELFGSVSVSHTLTPDRPEVYLLKRGVKTALVGLKETKDGLQRVYEAAVLKDTIDETKLHFQLSNRCCTELKLPNGETVVMDVRFQLERVGFCEMHKAVDILPNLRRVLPDLRENGVPVLMKSGPGELNEKQQAAMDFILGASDQGKCVAPLLIYGPFGTGKTLTLAKITLTLAERPKNKILICTHTNSSADLYVKDHFHSSVSSNQPARPLRIKAKELPLSSTDDITIKYCHFSKDGRYFEFPDRGTVDAAKIIITTTSVARFFHDMCLPTDYFSHILIDEASQMLECQALMALGLAGEKTQVVLAGDHMQMGPKLFSVDEDRRSDYTLLNRLFHYYQADNSTAAKNSRIIFSENYRSTKEIVDFVSTHFYVGKKDVIKAKGNVHPHPDQKALVFYHVHGECILDKRSLTYVNPTEIQMVVDVVQNVLTEWPDVWGKKDPASVCVLSQGSQVMEIRKRMRKVQLHSVTVENAENVQGKQFRVIIITTVHTQDSLMVSDQSSLEFFNDMRLLNTCMTRAQSQVIVVGDAAALCCSKFGKCWRLWRSYVEHCIDTESVYPEDFTMEYLDQEHLEISNIIPSDKDDSSDESSLSEIQDIEDPILKELLDESKDLQIQLTEEGLFPVLHADSRDNSVLRRVCESQPPIPRPQRIGQDRHAIHRCEVFREKYYSGYAISLDDPTFRIEIKGRKNLGRTFHGDEAEVEVLSTNTSTPKGRVVGVFKHKAMYKDFVCMIDTHDDQVMMPINPSVPKLFTPFWKDKPNHIAVRKPGNWAVERFVKINEEARRNNLFVVKFLRWRERFYWPLGVVVNVLPRVTSLQDGLKVLAIDYQLKRIVPESVEREVMSLKDKPLLTNDCKDFSKLMTFTVDPAHCKDMDDAISVRDLGEHYEIGVHIADVANFVAKDSKLDQYARKQGTTFYVSEGEPSHMLPKTLSTNLFSLLPNCKRRCISLMTTVDKQTHRICGRAFFRSVICSKKKLSYEEAEDILKSSGSEYSFDTLEGCLAIACLFAEVHRKDRKPEDWCYKSPDEDTVIGKRRSHMLVEELMIMFNHTVSDRLLFDGQLMRLTPLRCQDRPRPDPEQLAAFHQKNASLLLMSVHLSSQITDLSQTDNAEDERSNSEYFPVLTSLLNNLENAAQERDIYRMLDLITTDEIHPHLLPLVISFKRFITKADVLRASTTHLSRVGHYDLGLTSYTWASSPIRRYIDIIVQRLLHCALDKTEVKYTSCEIDHCCVEFTQRMSQQSACEKKSYALSMASKLSSQNARKLAYIVEINPTENNFRISFPLNKTSLSDIVRIPYRELQLVDQPKYDEEDESMILRWERRVYSFSSPSIVHELKLQNINPSITYVPSETWKGMVAAIRQTDQEIMFDLVHSAVSEKQLASRNTHITTASPKLETGIENEQHYIELSLKLKQGSVIEVQLSTDHVRGLMVPAVQLLIVNPKFEICMEHTKNPISCFSKYAVASSRMSYNTYIDYQKIWKPLCEMESATSAVAENDSIVIEDATLTWKNTKAGLKGSFNLPLDKKNQWAIDGNLRNSFLCIRLRMKKSDCTSLLEDSLKNDEEGDLIDVPGFIWIAHGVITNVSAEDESKQLKYMEIDFRINHMPMLNIPNAIFSASARFTLELIPKPLPDVRKENALDNLTKANALVKAIATGSRIPDKRDNLPINPSRFDIENHQSSFGFPVLNNSQNRAIREALNNTFTVIQGPPGTGKTVVGVHIVYWFFRENQKQSPQCNIGDEKQKKTCILYCGPSNKSVDVVADQLLKLQNKLKPLRVYSDQMEIQEFPYPGSNLRLSRHSRVEKPNKNLRSITLHHRIRMPSNPFSTQIQAFDLKIQRDAYLSEEEMKSYKDCLIKARKHELLQHDVILCTCTAASHPILTDVLNFHQIIIDECAMATEPETFIPLVTHKPKQIVLLGDHKQLQPVVHCDLAQKLGMRKSLFERYTEKALMLDTQYRMHEDICAFPSGEFYGGNLKTGIHYAPSVFLNCAQKPTSIIFGHVEGKERSLVVTTERGNENSKANIEEAEEVVRIGRCLIRAGIKEKDIAILTPYNAQVAKISEILHYNLMNITVNTIMKSQGSEWRYVILSTVRSCQEDDIEIEPSKAWNLKRLGFVMDPHQVNVGITRAQQGLCIIGNTKLLKSSFLWRRLLGHYRDKNCLVDPAQNIQITLA